MFRMGLGILICVPIFKTVTHLPPFMGILFGLGILWLVGELLHRSKEDEDKEHLTLVRALQADRHEFHRLLHRHPAGGGDPGAYPHPRPTWPAGSTRPSAAQDVIVTIIGLVSAIVDNVPLVAASMGMYSLAQYPTDSFLWEFMAYCAGTGGSILIIGSAAGVAAMGLEKIHFFWYVKRISAAGPGRLFRRNRCLHRPVQAVSWLRFVCPAT